MQALSPGSMPDAAPVILCKPGMTSASACAVHLCLGSDQEQKLEAVLDPYANLHEKRQERDFADGREALDALISPC